MNTGRFGESCDRGIHRPNGDEFRDGFALISPEILPPTRVVGHRVRSAPHTS